MTSRRKLEREAAALVAEAWAVYYQTGDPADEKIARTITEAAGQPIPMKPEEKPRRPSRLAEKRRIRQRSITINPDAPIFAQVRDIVR